MPVKQRTQYICDRCGWDSEKNPHKFPHDFGDCTVSWQGHLGGYGLGGHVGGCEVKGKAWLCLQCTRAFLAFIKEQAIEGEAIDQSAGRGAGE